MVIQVLYRSYSKLPQHYDLSMVDRLVRVSAKDRIYDRRQFEYQTDFKLLACKQAVITCIRPCVVISLQYYSTS